MSLPLDEALCLGLDLGTSGVRGVALAADGRLAAQARVALPAPEREGTRVTQDPALWWQAVQTVMGQLIAQVPAARVAAIAVDGTSGTLLLTDAAGTPLSAGWMYNDASCTAEAARIAAAAPPDSPAQGHSSPLARLLHLQAAHPQAAHALHQADWIANRLCGHYGLADENNVLKLGHDVQARAWPAWFDALGVRRELLPAVQPPGTAMGRISPALARAWGLPPEVIVAAGSTDGVAAFLATGAAEVGDAVTSLGSTLVIKLLSDRPVSAAAFGLYSHRLGEHWLPGGASNSGGAALLRFFSAERMAQMTPLLRPDEPTGLAYYPLPGPGERFPVNDPQLAPRVTPRPADDVRFFQGLLEGVAEVERLAFQRLAALGAPPVRRVFSVGGGARNAAWTRIRERVLGVPVLTPPQDEAAVGAARLARQALEAAP
jgi:sugar (pentulose or hexulose) kinase